MCTQICQRQNCSHQRSSSAEWFCQLVTTAQVLLLGGINKVIMISCKLLIIVWTTETRVIYFKLLACHSATFADAYSHHIDASSHLAHWEHLGSNTQIKLFRIKFGSVAKTRRGVGLPGLFCVKCTKKRIRRVENNWVRGWSRMKTTKSSKLQTF